MSALSQCLGHEGCVGHMSVVHGWTVPNRCSEHVSNDPGVCCAGLCHPGDWSQGMSL